eukprot:symbB.v1.2.012287.t1/scaffold847.1/size158198/2
MGCSSSAPTKMTAPQAAFTPKVHGLRNDGGHGFDIMLMKQTLQCQQVDFKENELEDPISSWEMKGVPEGYPVTKLLAPDRKLHEKHVKKLHKFLKEVRETPTELAERVSEKRGGGEVEVQLAL